MQQVVALSIDREFEVLFFEAAQVNEQHHVSVVDGFEEFKLDKTQVVRHGIAGGYSPGNPLGLSAIVRFLLNPSMRATDQFN